MLFYEYRSSYESTLFSADAEKALVGADRAVFLRKSLQVETFAKKGDPTEPKTLVIYRHVY